MKQSFSLAEQCVNVIDGIVFAVLKPYVKKMFLAGESIDEGLQSTARLKDKGYDVTYHIMAEDLTDVRHVQANVRTNIALILRAQERGLLGNLAIKMSAFGGSLPEAKEEKHQGLAKIKANSQEKYHSLVATYFNSLEIPSHAK